MVAMKQQVGDLYLATVVINVQDMDRAIRFWTAALGYVQREDEKDPEFVMLTDPDGERLPVSLQRADSPPREPVRIHLDLYTNEQARHVRRLTGLGGRAWTIGPTPRTRTLLSCVTLTAMSSALLTTLSCE